MPSIKVVPTTDSSRIGYNQVQAAIRARAPPGRCRSSRPRPTPPTSRRSRRHDPGIAALMPTQTGSDGLALVTAIPQPGPVEPRRRARRSTGCAASCPPASLIGGAVAENHDLQSALSAKTPLVIGVVMGLGFLLLLIALQAPLIAAAGVLTNLLAIGAAFGVAKWIFQDGDAALAARLPAAGVPRRLGAGVLLRDDLRDLDGLHGVPALLRQGALGPHRRPPRTRWSAGSRTPAA